MAVKILVDRHINPRERAKVVELLKQLRARCLDEPGYITGETLRDNADENHLLVISTWFGLGDWRRWQASPDRKQFEEAIRPLLTAPERVQVFLDGISDSIAGA